MEADGDCTALEPVPANVQPRPTLACSFRAGAKCNGCIGLKRALNAPEFAISLP
jgi:hypothetical protein